METIAPPTVAEPRPTAAARPEDDPMTAERRELAARELREAIRRKVGVSGRSAAGSR